MEQNYQARLAGATSVGASISIPKRVGGAYLQGRLPAAAAARLGALAIDLLVLSPFATAVAVAWVTFARASAGRLQPTLLMAVGVILVAHWMHTFLLEGTSGSATIGKRFVRIQVVDGFTAKPLGLFRALARRAVCDLWVVGSLWAASRLTALRQVGDPFEPMVYGSADWLVYLAFLLVFVVPWVSVRTCAYARQWPHDRLAGAVVVVPARREREFEARPVPPVAPGPGGPGRPVSLLDRTLFEAAHEAARVSPPVSRRRGLPPVPSFVNKLPPEDSEPPARQPAARSAPPVQRKPVAQPKPVVPAVPDELPGPEPPAAPAGAVAEEKLRAPAAGELGDLPVNPKRPQDSAAAADPPMLDEDSGEDPE